MLKKVDWTNNETRLYMIIKNTGKNDVDVFPDQGKIVQKGKQKEAYYSNNIFTVTNCSNFTISGFVINVNSNQKNSYRYSYVEPDCRGNPSRQNRTRSREMIPVGRKE